MYRGTSIVCNFQVYFLFLLINIFSFHIDIVYECIVHRCIVEHKLIYLTYYLIFMACASACVVVNTAICVK